MSDTTNNIFSWSHYQKSSKESSKESKSSVPCCPLDGCDETEGLCPSCGYCEEHHNYEAIELLSSMGAEISDVAAGGVSMAPDSALTAMLFGAVAHERQKDKRIALLKKFMDVSRMVGDETRDLRKQGVSASRAFTLAAELRDKTKAIMGEEDMTALMFAYWLTSKILKDTD